MSGPSGVMSVILLETAVGGSVVLWASGVWGVVRRGFFLLTGVTVTLCALGAWALTRTEVAAAPRAGGGTAAAGLAVFAGLLVLWQVLLLARLETPARAAGVVAAAAGVVTLPLVAQLRDSAVATGIIELALGALFLGATLYGLLLGHWYLVERRLDQRWMIRGVWWYIAGVAGGIGAAALSAGNPAPATADTGFSPFLAVPGFTVLLAGGLVAICAIIAGFVWKLAGEGGRSIQAATGYFYLAVIMAFSAELSSKFRFF
ncbi:MAG: hypothetical protein H0V05_21550 [Euzebyaceae bacterium]|nr:hypothetical protein [Euzebyaceae bacterium]